MQLADFLITRHSWIIPRRREKTGWQQAPGSHSELDWHDSPSLVSPLPLPTSEQTPLFELAVVMKHIESPQQSLDPKQGEASGTHSCEAK